MNLSQKSPLSQRSISFSPTHRFHFRVLSDALTEVVAWVISILHGDGDALPLMVIGSGL